MAMGQGSVDYCEDERLERCDCAMAACVLSQAFKCVLTKSHRVRMCRF